MPMTPEKYSSRRDELLAELQKILQIEGLPDGTRKELNSVSRKLISNVFNIVLIGEFQGGKSTTFNSICDGREISPRGAMIKTSACKISAQNLPDQDVEEYAVLEWKRQDELVLTMIDLVSPYLREKAPERFKSKQDADMVQELRLTNPDDVALLKVCLDEEWERYRKSPSDYDPEATGKLDILYIARLIIENCAAEEYRDKIEGVEVDYGDRKEIEPVRTKVKIPDLAKYVVFPEKWSERWSEGDANGFSRGEVAFAFLGSVMCYLHSPNLARLGCVITDCPGLFASPWDTSVAEQAMMASDAILYLIGGQKAMSNSDLRALKKIRSTGQEHKLFFAVNAKSKRDLLKSTIVPADIGFLHNAGFDKTSIDNVYVFHALLGLCSRNGVVIKGGNFEPISTERFVRVSQAADDSYPSDAATLWPMVVEDNLRNYLSRGEFANKDVYIEDVVALGDMSGLNALLDVIEKTVVLKKAEALLVAGGSKPINAAMALLEAELKSKERVAQETAENFAAEERNAREILDAFAEEATVKIDTILERRCANGLVHDFADNVILAHIDELSDQVSGKFADNVLCFNKLLTSLNKKALQEKMRPIVEDATNAVIKPAVMGWLHNIISGDNAVYNDTLLVERQNILDALTRKWKDMVVSDHGNLLEGLDQIILSNPEGDFIPTDVHPENFPGLGGDLWGARLKMLLATVLTPILGAVAAVVIALILYVVLPTFVAAIIGATPVIIPLLVGALFSVKLSDKIKAKIKDAVIARMRTELRLSFTKPEVKDKVLEGGRKIVLEIQKMIHKNLRSAIDKQRAVFEERCQDAARAFAVGDAERQRISAEAMKLRTEHIEPAHAWCEEFETAVTAELTA